MLYIVNGVQTWVKAFLKDFRIQKKVYVVTGNQTIYSRHSGQTMVLNDAANSRTFTIDATACAASKVGSVFTFANLGTGRLTLQMPTGVSVNDSSATGTIYSDTDSVATIVIELLTATKFLVTGSTGSWTTT